MNNEGLDPHLLHAWLAARSLAHRLPMPVPEHGGFRVDTESETETVRWVFPRVGDGLKDVARTIHQPRQFVKVCDTGEERILPTGCLAILEAAIVRDWPLYDTGDGGLTYSYVE